MPSPVPEASTEKPEPSGVEALLQRLMEVARASALSEMASGIAHVINQPLGAIATFAQAGDRLLSRPQPDVGRALEVMRHISAEALQAGDNIHRIRRLFPTPPPRRVSCDFGEVVLEVTPLLEMLAEQSGADLEIELPEVLPAVAIDRLHVQYVLLTLVQNALEVSCEQQAPRIGVRAGADKYALETSVTDAGSGIPAAVREQLFRPFVTTKPEGSGLGLAAARAIIEAHQGTIGFESLDAGGSRFWFRLPLSI